MKVTESALGHGSTFVATVEANITDANPTTKTFKPNSIYQDLRGYKILLVEDSADNQLLVKSFLTKSGASVDVAANGLDGIRKALSNDFDIVLMDMQMPVLGGYEATERLRQQGYKKPIVALTAHAMAEERRRTLLAGCDAHLTKPLDFKMLSATISQLAK